ncbi:hypothetical protein HDU80_002732 [Chytriomyces hyalinus]|nr:hypothetical protein BJ741DRAFT_307695 [Chytriomyces cf. hyalinus JEL632]KAJ3378692.1 hypothetical protein HDU80_002732 [Chytriomyces hyalinus]
MSGTESEARQSTIMSEKSRFSNVSVVESTMVNQNDQFDEIDEMEEMDNEKRRTLIAGEVAAAVALIAAQDQQTTISSSNRKDTIKYFVNVDVPNLSAYVPPPTNTHVVVRGFHSTKYDEVSLEVGDIVAIERTFEDGWARGQIISRRHKRGYFPITVLTRQKLGASQSVAHDESGASYFLPKKRNSNGSTASTEQLYPHQIPERSTSIVEVEITRVASEKVGVQELRNRWERK